MNKAGQISFDIFDEDQYEETTVVKVPPDVVYLREQFSVREIMLMIKESEIVLDPEFQREKGVWSHPDRLRFIDSIIKQIPIPNFCFFKNKSDSKYYIIDGLQRISALQTFFSNNLKYSKPKDVLDKLKGIKGISSLEKNDQSNINAYFFPANVISGDIENISHREYLYEVFYRINKQGTKLVMQELRNAFYGGTVLFKSIKEEIKKGKEGWYKELKEISSFRSEKRGEIFEFILRAMGFYTLGYENYTSLSKMLDKFVEENKHNSFIEFIPKLKPVIKNIYKIKKKYYIDEPWPKTFTEPLIWGGIMGVSYNKVKIDKIRNFYFKNYKDSNSKMSKDAIKKRFKVISDLLK